MAEPNQRKGSMKKTVIIEKASGTVKWYSVKQGYGFLTLNYMKNDIFIHYTSISRNNPKKVMRSVGDGESVEFEVILGRKGLHARNVTGPNGKPVRGSPYVANRRRVNHKFAGYQRSGARGDRQPKNHQNGYNLKKIDSEQINGAERGVPQMCPCYSRRFSQRHLWIGRGGGNRLLARNNSLEENGPRRPQRIRRRRLETIDRHHISDSDRNDSKNNGSKETTKSDESQHVENTTRSTHI